MLRANSTLSSGSEYVRSVAEGGGAGGGEEVEHISGQELMVFFRYEDDSVGPGIEGVSSYHFTMEIVEGVHKSNDLSGSVVEVEDGWQSVQASGVELVAVGHGQFPESSEVLLLECFLNAG